MLKTALLFAGAGLAVVMLAPGLLPMLDLASHAPAPSTHVVALDEAQAIRPAAAAPSRDADESFHEVQIADNGHDQYWLDALVEGQPVRFIVDTGANIVSLNAETARKLGFSNSASAKHYTVNTANGQTAAYGVQLRSIDLGSIYIPNVDAIVNPNLGPMNLLGVNFLRRLSKVEQRDGRLILRQ